MRGLWWWLTSVMGDHDYDRYLAYLARHHPDQEPPTVREYWRERHAESDRNPGARCC